MKFTDLEKILNINKKLKIPTILWGCSGFGKTSVVKEYARKNNLKTIFVDAITVQPSLTVIPKINNEKVTLYPVPWLEEIVNAKEPTLLFVDELNRVESVSVFNLFISLFLSRKYQNLDISEHVQIIGACNYESEDSGTREIPDALMKRCMHLEWSPNKEEIIKNMNVNNNIKKNFFLLNLFSEKKSLFKENVLSKLNINPRQLEKACLFFELANNTLNNTIIEKCIEGLIGEGVSCIISSLQNSLQEIDLDFNNLKDFFNKVEELYNKGKTSEIIKFFEDKAQTEDIKKLAQIALLTNKAEIISSLLKIFKDVEVPTYMKMDGFVMIVDLNNPLSFKRLEEDVPVKDQIKKGKITYSMYSKLMGAVFDYKENFFRI